MAKAIARGLLQQENFTMAAAAPSLTPGINKEGIHTYNNNIEVIKNADIIILAVKPAQMSLVLKEIKYSIPEHSLLISIAAGLNLSWFASLGPTEQALIRTMPNTPAALGLAATPMIANQYVNAKQKKQAEYIFSQIGLTTWAEKEEDMDTFTALSGSGPAYVFLFLETLIKAAVTLGLNESIAKIFALQMMEGALKLAQNSDLSLNQLRTKVTSPGGTTAAALEILNEPLENLMLSAMRAAKNRAQELGSIQ